MIMYIDNTIENANQNNHNIATTISNHSAMWYYISILYDCMVWSYINFMLPCVMTVNTLDCQDDVDYNMILYLDEEALCDRAEMLSHVILWNQMNNRMFIVCSCCVMYNICTCGSWNNIYEHWLSFQVLKFDMG